MSQRYTEAEDNLLLSLLHTNYPSGRSESERYFDTIAYLMNQRALDHGIATKRVYKENSTYHHYSKILGPVPILP